jgi:SAM-dependent methyltransferase
MVYSNVRAFARERFWVWRCSRCASIHAGEELELTPYYSKYPFFDVPLDWRLRAIYGEQRHRLEAAGVRWGDRILDYGCGSGAFVRYLTASGYESVAGFDAYNSRYDDVAVLSGSYDCLVSQDVLEHVADPQALLDDFQRLVRPGGLIAIGTPNAAAIDLCRTEAYKHALHVPYHRHIFSRAALLAAAERRGWSLITYHATQYANTVVPFLNSRFYQFFARTLDDTLDSLLEQPPELQPCLARLPSAVACGLCGYYCAEETDGMAIFRAPRGQGGGCPGRG